MSIRKFFTSFAVSAVMMLAMIGNAVCTEAAESNAPSLSSPDVHSYSVADSMQFRSKENVQTRRKLSLVEYEEVDREEAVLKQTLKPGEHHLR